MVTVEPVGRELRQCRGELRHDGELVVDVVELLADRGEDGAADQGAGEGRVERVGLGGQRHPQRAAGFGRSGCH